MENDNILEPKAAEEKNYQNRKQKVCKLAEQCQMEEYHWIKVWKSLKTLSF